MSKKVDRAVHGPGWGEVIFGAVLSLILGIALGAVLMVIKPVITAKEPPKEPVPGALYYIEGVRGDANKAKLVMAKRKALADGQTIKVTEDEVNALIGAAQPAKPGEKPGAPAPATETLTTGTPNVRIRNGVMQVAVPVTLSVAGIEQKLIAQARGGFEKDGDVFTYDPAELYLGSCPVQRIPFLAGYVRSKVLAKEPIPDDIKAAWAKLKNVTIEGNTLVLAMQ